MQDTISFSPRKYLIVMSSFFLIPIQLYIDSPTFNELHQWQWLANCLMCYYFVFIYLDADIKLKKLLLLMVLYGTGIEILGTMVFKLYRYRLDNIPLYVPLGHATLFGVIYHLQRLLAYKGLSRQIASFLYLLSLPVSLFSLLVVNDVAGVACFTLFFLILSTKKNKPFYLLMFYMVLYMEILGTQLNVWTWVDVFKGPFYDIPIGNPPTGIGGVYIVMDMLACSSYLLIRKRRTLTRQLITADHS
jgi:hypothetical protein